MDRPREYRKLPVVITAQQFDSDKGHRLVGEFAAAICRKPHDGFAYTELPSDPRRAGSPHIHTLEGPLGVSNRDWIVKGIKGEFYAVKPDIFQASYEVVGAFKAPRHFVSASCEGETCACGRLATHKVGEEIPDDDPVQMRHNFTAHVCCIDFRAIFGGAVFCDDGPTVE